MVTDDYQSGKPMLTFACAVVRTERGEQNEEWPAWIHHGRELVEPLDGVWERGAYRKAAAISKCEANRAQNSHLANHFNFRGCGTKDTKETSTVPYYCMTANYGYLCVLNLEFKNSSISAPLSRDKHLVPSKLIPC
jgi:hypothetical protein